MMPQMSLYFDEALASRVAKGAKRERVSVSRYVSRLLNERMDDNWSDDFLETLGSVSDKSFKRPRQPGFSSDSKREVL
jgi:cytochrome P450